METQHNPTWRQGAWKRIKQYREARGVTQAQVAEALGISRGTYNRFERWGMIPSTPAGVLTEDMVIAAIDGLS